MNHIKQVKNEDNLGMGGDEPGASNSFFCPTDGFFEGVFAVAPPSGGVADEI